VERRTLLIGVGALASVALTAGVVETAVLNRTGFFSAILRRCLPDAILLDAEVEEFAAAYWPLMERRFGKRIALTRLLHAADRLLVPGELHSTEALERDILTNFLIGSNFFALTDPKAEPIDFIDMPVACTNPFRRV
jgi:hypothetical protein